MGSKLVELGMFLGIVHIFVGKDFVGIASLHTKMCVRVEMRAYLRNEASLSKRIFLIFYDI